MWWLYKGVVQVRLVVSYLISQAINEFAYAVEAISLIVDIHQRWSTVPVNILSTYMITLSQPPNIQVIALE